MEYYEKRDTIPELENYTEIFETRSEIQNFYAGKTVFITGGVGFLGRLAIEKLLRSCGELRKIYLLMRPKRGKAPEQRLSELFECEIFESVKQSNPNVMSLVEVMEGDGEKEMLGLSHENIEKIRNEVNIVFHIAASLNMDSPLRLAYNMNIRCTIDLLEICCQAKNLQSFIYVSTAYSNAFLHEVAEKFYKPVYDHKELKQILDMLSDEEICSISQKIIGKWLNSYAFTKAIAEDIVSTYTDKLPVAVIRPSIVIGCAKEPLRNWINNIYGVTGVSAGACPGFIRVWYANPDKIADIIPADYIINGMLAVAWDIAGPKKINQEPVYNLVSSPKAPTTWGEYTHLVEENCVMDFIAVSQVIGPYNFRLQKRLWLFNVQVLLMHALPGLLIDTILTAIKKEPRLLKGYIKVKNFNMKIGPYSDREWVYHEENVNNLLKNMSKQDKSIFYFDMNGFNWKEYHRYTIRGIRAYILKDPMSNLDEARKNYLKMRNYYRAAFAVIGILTYLCTKSYLVALHEYMCSIFI